MGKKKKSKKASPKQVKKKRGRPKGSTNKNTGTTTRKKSKRLSLIDFVRVYQTNLGDATAIADETGMSKQAIANRANTIRTNIIKERRIDLVPIKNTGVTVDYDEIRKLSKTWAKGAKK